MLLPIGYNRAQFDILIIFGEVYVLNMFSFFLDYRTFVMKEIISFSVHFFLPNVINKLRFHPGYSCDNTKIFKFSNP